MLKKEIFKRLADMVSKVCGVGDELLSKSRRQEYVEARVMLIQSLIDLGFHEKDIALTAGLSRQGINKLKNSFPIRMKRWAFRQQWNELRQNIEGLKLIV